MTPPTDSIVIELQKGCLDPRTSTLDILRKAMVVAKKLGIAEYHQWIELEVRGYKAGQEIPEYRRVSGQIKAWNPYRGWIDAVFEDPKLQDQLSVRYIGQPTGEIEAILENGKSSTYHVPFDPQTEHELMRGSQVPLKPTLEVSVGEIKGILDGVRTAVLNWSLDLEAKGGWGRGMTFSEREKHVASAANHHVHFHGPVTTSQIQQGSNHPIQTIASQIDLKCLASFAADARSRIPELALAPDLARQMMAEITSIEAQLSAPEPRRSVIAECLKSVRTILEGCVGSLIATGLLQQLAAIWPR